MKTQETDTAEAVRRVLILGGGFAGVYTALSLERELRPADRTQVTLVNRENYFLFTPFVCEVAASAIDPTHAVNPIRRLLRWNQFVEGEIIDLDTEHRSVSVRQPDGGDRAYGYEHLVIALGAGTAFFGMQDVQQHALTATTLGDAIHLRNWAIELLEIAAVDSDPAARTELLTFVVVGGGFTGVEMAGALNALLRQALRAYRNIAARDVRVILVEALPRLLPQFNERLARSALGALRSCGVEVRLNTRIAGARDHAVLTKDGEWLPTRTLVWASGVAPH
ncbi:MAG: NAD(P)/FAD-dependent oxidoreductase, partial [Chloroflexota bacterium]